MTAWRTEGTSARWSVMPLSTEHVQGGRRLLAVAVSRRTCQSALHVLRGPVHAHLRPVQLAVAPRLIGLQSFWDFQPQWTVVHAEEVGDPAHDPLHMGQLLVAQGVLVAAMASGCPNVDEAIDVMNSNAGIARDVREGKLITVEVTPGHFRLAHASRAVPLLGASDVHAQASHRCPPGRSGHMRARATRPAAALNDEGPAPCRALRSGSDGTRTRDLRRDRPAL
jgi:hypothetical protein